MGKSKHHDYDDTVEDNEEYQRALERQRSRQRKEKGRWAATEKDE
jgi:hypothetical protein